MILDQPRTRAGVPNVSLFVHLEEAERTILRDPVKTLEPIDLGVRDRGNLRLVDVQRGESRFDRQIVREMGERVDQFRRCRGRSGTRYPIARDAQTLGEAQPELGMVFRAAFLFDSDSRAAPGGSRYRRIANESRSDSAERLRHGDSTGSRSHAAASAPACRASIRGRTDASAGFVLRPCDRASESIGRRRSIWAAPWDAAPGQALAPIVLELA